jgi:hypothetical protein
LKFVIPVAIRFFAVAREKIGPSRAQISREVLDDQGDRIDLRTRPVKERRIVELIEGVFGKVLVPVELDHHVVQHGAPLAVSKVGDHGRLFRHTLRRLN